MKRLVLLLAAYPTFAHAWESECRAPAQASQFGGRNNVPQQSICAGDDSPFCVEGTGFARGVQMGEHAWLARQAMVAAGLSSLMGEKVLKYYTDGTNVETPQGPIPTLQPASSARMNHQVTRQVALHEYAQLPDGSHSLSDWILGNEHCVVANLPSGTPEKTEACHRFNPHMGAINSTHFQPQAQLAYLQFHRTALNVAESCKDMVQKLGASGVSLEAGAMKDSVLQECEHEALAWESLASHYLADAWSTGHMWQRWGSPLADPDPRKRMNQAVVAVISGMIHGWRSVARTKPLVEEHDQLCMAGPFDASSSNPNDRVMWRVSGRTDAAEAGGGDLYLLPCLAYRQSPDWAVSSGSQLQTQYKRMVGCMALGMAEVYNAGPQSQGAATVNSFWLDSAISGFPTPSQSACWDQRVTNQSFRLGLMMGDDDNVADPGFLGGIIVNLAKNNVIGGLEGITDDMKEAMNRQLRFQLIRMAEIIDDVATRDPNGMQLANLEPQGMRSLLGQARNGDFSGQVPYWEPSEDSSWWQDPILSCTTDADCITYGAYFCDHTQKDGPACVKQDAAVLRAFRDAELDHWCQRENESVLSQAVEQCKTVHTEEACQACVWLLKPYAANACDSATFQSRWSRDAAHQSACQTALGVNYAPQSVWVPHASGVANLEAELRWLCENGEVTPPSNYWRPQVDVDVVELTQASPSTTVQVQTQGPGRRLRFTVSATDPHVMVTPAEFTLDSGATQTLTISMSDFSTPVLADVLIETECSQEKRARVHVRAAGDGFDIINFDTLGGGAFAGDEYLQSKGVQFTPTSGMYLVGGDDDHSDPYGLCPSSNNQSCDSGVSISFTPPVKALSLYVGDQDVNTTNPFTLNVYSSAGAPVSIQSPREDRRFYSFTAPDIGRLEFSASSDWELLDDIEFAR